MNNERPNWKEICNNAQETLDAQRRGEIGKNITLVTATGTISAKDWETGEWMTIKDRGLMKVVDDPGNL